MIRHSTPFGIVVWMIWLPSAAFAERPPQFRKDAKVILVGTVQSIEESWQPLRSDYRILVHVEKVERGQDIHEGDVFAASCFRAFVPLGFGGAAGHKSIPDVGDRVQIYVNGRGLEGEGVYPDWCDVLEASWWGWFTSFLNVFRSRSWYLMGALAIVAGWWTTRRIRRACRARTKARSHSAPAATPPGNVAD